MLGFYEQRRTGVCHAAKNDLDNFSKEKRGCCFTLHVTLCSKYTSTKFQNLRYLRQLPVLKNYRVREGEGKKTRGLCHLRQLPALLGAQDVAPPWPLLPLHTHTRTHTHTHHTHGHTHTHTHTDTHTHTHFTHTHANTFLCVCVCVCVCVYI